MGKLVIAMMMVFVGALLFASCAASSSKTMRCPGKRMNPPKHFSMVLPQAFYQQSIG